MLPPATLTASPSRDEVDFRRLLARTEDLLSRNDTNALCITPETAKLATTTLDVWEEDKERGEFDKAVLSEYAQAIQRLSRVIDDVKLVSPIDHSLSQNRSMTFVQSHDKERLQESMQELRLRRRAEQVMKEALLQERQQRTSHAVEGGPLRKSNDDLRRELFGHSAVHGIDTRNDDLESILRRDRAMQNELTDDMARLASVLKNNVTAFGDILRKDEQVVSDMQSTMTTSVDRLGREGHRLGAFRKQAGKTTIFT
ncbi:vesicle transport protein [Syncephalis pseudoplumigaleata]|uniref:Vesicle transport protein n=1 Tax=Syncephalis pseudoplumigaleata TaxID=1712513 RepID=A0A4P9YSC6_9FUNG|nr:vesicle transport protein [Syncephalis pseudoplumigaleata]|eukprot:RKP22767.1 vesicle transport protein [Syncephalis pseudoplumigaleata]